MTWVKICGITNLEDALLAVDAGADALGFVFYEKSPRKIEPDVAREIVRDLPGSVERVGVFVEEPLQHMEDVAGRVGLTAIQMHIDPSRHGLSAPDWKLSSCTKKYVGLPANWLFDQEGFKGFAWSAGAENTIDGVFLDSATPGQPGGTGKTFDWKHAEMAVAALGVTFNVIVAGGLTPTNVSDAMRILKPWGVDVASGVETSPGKKDPEKVRAFVAAVREADRQAQ